MKKYLPEICSAVPLLSNIQTITFINKGYSNEQKFKITTNNGATYLLRLAQGELANRKQNEFKALRKFAQLGVSCSRPIFVGLTRDNNCFYSLLSWIHGNDAGQSLPHLTKKQQYAVGFFAGIDLRKIHTLAAPPDVERWKDYFLRKWKLNRDIYFQNNIHLDDDTQLLDFINNNLSLIVNRPTVFQHDDFHPSNIIVNQQKYAGIIDFNRCDYGDPWHDFVKMYVFGSEVSREFCRGQIDGYFNKQTIPNLFWETTALYVAVSLFITITWTQRVAPHELKQMLNRTKRICQEFNNFTKSRPSWLTKKGTQQFAGFKET